MIPKISKSDRIFIIQQRHKNERFSDITNTINSRNSNRALKIYHVKHVFAKFQKSGTILYNSEMRQLLTKKRPLKINGNAVINLIQDEPNLSVRKIQYRTGTKSCTFSIQKCIINSFIIYMCSIIIKRNK